MSEISLTRSPEEIAEIEKHKYYLSEKAGRDVGWEAAEKDWDSKYADQYRRSENSSIESSLPTEGGNVLKRLLAKVRPH